MLKPNNQLTPVNKEAGQTAGPPAMKEDSLTTLMRLLVGGAVIGADELLRRAKKWQAEIEPMVAPKMVVAPFSELEESYRRHAVIGLLFEMPDVIWEGVVKASEVSGTAGGMVGKLFGPIVNSRLARPVKQRYDKLVTNGESTLDRWAERGRAEERVSRVLAEQAFIQLFDEVMDEVMIHLAHKPEVRELLQQQSLSMANEVVDEVRHRTAGGDALLERVARAILRRSPHEAVIELPAPSAKNEEKP